MKGSRGVPVGSADVPSASLKSGPWPQILGESGRDAGAPGFATFANRTMVIIPAYNEEECVGDVVRRLREKGFLHIRVVDNASTDCTSENARAAGAEVIRTTGRGYGLACWEGAQNVPDGIEWLLFCNADASDDFDAYEEFAKLSVDHELILGSRTHPNDRCHMSGPQRFGNWLAPALIRLVWGYRFADLGPQRAIRVDAFRRLGMADRGFGWTVEMQVRAVEEGLRIAEISVRSHPRPAGQSKISGNLRGSLAAGWVILTTLARLKAKGGERWERRERRRPADFFRMSAGCRRTKRLSAGCQRSKRMPAGRQRSQAPMNVRNTNPAGWKSRGYLPHFDGGELLQFVTFRLHDSVPSELVGLWKEQLGLLVPSNGKEISENQIELLRRVAKYEDAGHGACWLADPTIAQVIQNAILHFDGERYRIISWCIMPNHVHVLLETWERWPLADILQSWKSYTAKKANEHLGRTGIFWQREYYDRFVRNEAHLHKVLSYIEQNPVKAGLVREAKGWSWSGRGAGVRSAGVPPAFLRCRQDAGARALRSCALLRGERPRPLATVGLMRT